MSFFKRILDGLRKTKENISRKLYRAFKGAAIDEEFYEELEYALLCADVGAEATESVLEDLRDICYERKLTTPDQARQVFEQLLIDMIDYEVPEYEYPLCILVAGVNGVGKTTAIGKLANYFVSQGKSVVLAAADTFRAAAGEQLSVWGERSGVRVIRHEEGADAGAVVFDAISSAKAKKTDVLLIDTAGRLHNKKNLMEELKKINRIVMRDYPEADYRSFIVLDATTGQNALTQVNLFDEAIDIDGIILTKLDGTAKGGVVLAICHEKELPVLYVGVGEGKEDLLPFDAKDFVEAIMSE
ncbi:MAG: signal recognition particle-docking protein FtsY [Clostridia bacterium]|nr:signal recognition particle-docking protein FtsY [Clostridia bacterium]